LLEDYKTEDVRGIRGQGINERFSKLCLLNGPRTEKTDFMIHSSASSVSHFVHQYYRFPLETLLGSGYLFPAQDLRAILYPVMENVTWLSAMKYVHLDLNLSSFFVDATSAVKLGNLTRVLQSSDFKFLGDYSRNLENSSPEFLLGERKKWKESMVWSLGVVLD
jgi:hypothetical protein